MRSYFMEDWQKKNFETLKKYIANGWVKKDTKLEDVKYDEGDPYLEADKVILPIGYRYLYDDGAVTVEAVLWL